MKKVLALLLSILFIIPIGIAFGNSGQVQQQVYISPNLQGIPIAKLDPATPIYLNIFDLPKNMNLLLFDMQRIYNGQLHLSRQYIINQFAPTDQLEEQISFLQSQGFTIVFKTPFSLIVEAPAAIVNKVFNTTLYLYKINNEIVYKPEYNPTIPSPLRNALITGLTNYTSFQPSLMTQHIVLGKLAKGVLEPVISLGSLNFTSLSPMVGLQFAFTYYTAKDLEGAYNVTDPGGQNVTVAIIDAFGDPEIQQDIQQFDAKFGLPPANLTVIPIGPYNPEFGIGTGWDVETALDVEAVHAIDPSANIQLVVAYSNSFAAILQAIIYIVSGDTAQVVSMSFGAPENEFTASGLYAFYQGVAFPNYPLVDYYFALGTAEGITFVASSGDQGAYEGTPISYGGVLFPASSPFVLAVGGTSLYVNVTSGYLSAENSTAVYGYETAWSVLPQYEGLQTSTVSSGGGYSTFFPTPYSQKLADGSNTRATPDVSAVGNPYTGFVIVVEGAEEVIGGTSLAAPIWAGTIANIDSYIGHPIGSIAPILYSIYQNSSIYNRIFHQVTLGFNGQYYSHPGYNLVTGLGTPTVGLLEQAVKEYLSLHQSLKISLMTYEPGVTIPWYMYGTTFTVVADISYPNGTIVTSGNFTAYIYTLSGYLASIPLIFNGTFWVGNYTIQQGEPPNVWSIVVNGTSAGYSGSAQTDINVGESINILLPVATYIPVNTPFQIQAYIAYPNGVPVENQTFHVYFVQGGRTVFTTTLLPTSTPGLYQGFASLIYPQPQGAYLIFVNNTYGSAYGWDYFGLLVFGAVIPPINDGFTSISAGENVTVVALVFNELGLGIFTSQAYAELLTVNGTLIEKVPMKLAPNAVQFGFLNLFGYHEANITIPGNLGSGFYKIVVAAELNTSTGPLYGNFTTFIYVSASKLNYQVKSITTAVEGQYVKVMANITYPNGTEVKFGEFTAGFIPTQSNYEAIQIEFAAGIPLQYNSTLGEWIGVYQIPSILTEQGTIYQGIPLQSLAGPWNVIISGTSAVGNNVLTQPYYFTVLPYTYLGNLILTPSNITKIPLVSFNGTSYILQGIYANSLKLEGFGDPITIVNSYIGSLKIVESVISLTQSKVNTITAISSDITLIQDTIGDAASTAITLVNSNATIVATVIYNSTYAFNQTNSLIKTQGVSYQNVMQQSVLPTPYIVSYSPTNITTSTATITLNIFGEQLKVIGVSMNGMPITYTATPTSNGITVTIPFEASIMPAGPYTIVLNVSDGLVYTLTATVYNSYPQQSLSSSISSLSSSISTSLSLASRSISNVNSTATIGEILGIIGIIIGLIAIILVFIFRRGGGTK